VHKPHKVYFDRIVRELGVEPQTIVMVGDKVQFDVAGGNKAGMWTVLVDPYGKDAFHDKLLLIRWRHNRLLKRARSALKLVQELQK
jgi:predicted HAD superfamily phosphohydrolase YqeG